MTKYGLENQMQNEYTKETKTTIAYSLVLLWKKKIYLGTKNKIQMIKIIIIMYFLSIFKKYLIQQDYPQKYKNAKEAERDEGYLNNRSRRSASSVKTYDIGH